MFEIIGPLVQMDTKGLTAFTRMTDDVVKAMRAARSRSWRPSKVSAQAPAPSSRWHPICAWRRLAQGRIPVQQGGPCWLRHGRLRDPPSNHRAVAGLELLYTGRFMSAEEGERWGFFSRMVTRMRS